MTPIQDDGSMVTQGIDHVGDGMEYLDPSLAATLTGLDEQELQGFTSITSNYSSIKRQVPFWHTSLFSTTSSK